MKSITVDVNAPQCKTNTNIILISILTAFVKICKPTSIPRKNIHSFPHRNKVWGGTIGIMMSGTCNQMHQIRKAQSPEKTTQNGFLSFLSACRAIREKPAHNFPLFSLLPWSSLSTVCSPRYKWPARVTEKPFGHFEWHHLRRFFLGKGSEERKEIKMGTWESREFSSSLF